MATKDTHIIDIRTKGAKKSKTAISGVSSSLKTLGKRAGAAALAYFGTVGLINGIKSATDAFGQQELAERKLRFSAGKSTDELIKQAKAIQRVSKFGDEAIIAQQAYVKSLGISTEQTKEIIAASVDLASAMGISLESAVMNTTKTLSGMQGELGEKLPAAFKELTPEALKAGEGIKFIADQFKGQARNEVETYTGSLAQMSNAVGDAAEELGEMFAPAVIGAANAIKFMAEKFSDVLNFQDKYDRHLEAEVELLTEAKLAAMSYEESLTEMSKAELLNELLELGNAIDGVSHSQIDAMISSGELRDTINSMIEVGALESELLLKILDIYVSLPDVVDSTSSSYAKFEEAQLRRIKQQEKEAELMELFIQKNPELAKSMGLVSKEEKRRTELTKTLGKQYKEIQLSQIIGDTFAAARAQFKEYSKAYPAPLGNILGAAAYTATVAQGYKDYDSVRAAQYGADFITDGPQMMLVGEGTGPERVQVTPLVDENIDGPQGGMTINIQGSVIGTEEFTEDVLIPQIKEGLRLGGDIGSN